MQLVSIHNDRVSPGHHKRPQDGGQMNSERRPGGGGRDSTGVLTRTARAPDLVLRYGDGAEHVADVHLPPTAVGPREGTSARAPLIIFLHGGFWRADYGREHTRPLAEALADAGFVVCAPEYRRTGQAGGGWPGTFDDVAAAVDLLPGLVAEATDGLVAADPADVVLAGHSAGGHLALWAASRNRLPEGSRWHTGGSGWRGVVALAAVTDLAAGSRKALGRQAAGELMGGWPRIRPSSGLPGIRPAGTGRGGRRAGPGCRGDPGGLRVGPGGVVWPPARR